MFGGEYHHLWTVMKCHGYSCGKHFYQTTHKMVGLTLHQNHEARTSETKLFLWESGMAQNPAKNPNSSVKKILFRPEI
jgi:hypothetical protein